MTFSMNSLKKFCRRNQHDLVIHTSLSVMIIGLIAGVCLTWQEYSTEKDIGNHTTFYTCNITNCYSYEQYPDDRNPWTMDYTYSLNILGTHCSLTTYKRSEDQLQCQTSVLCYISIYDDKPDCTTLSLKEPKTGAIAGFIVFLATLILVICGFIFLIIMSIRSRKLLT